MTNKERDEYLRCEHQCRAQADEARACGDEEHAYTMRKRASWYRSCANPHTSEELRKELLDELRRHYFTKGPRGESMYYDN